jgi:carbon-monoxide dehydrogenase small subunit
MLITGRDIVMRLPDADEARIRLELSGNLCRCTGYVGIVHAIHRVLKARRAGALAAAPVPGAVLGPVGARRARPAAQHSPGPAVPSVPAATEDGSAQNVLGLAGREPNIELRQSLLVSCPPQEVWTFLGDIGRVVRCLPGAILTEAPQAENVRGKFSVKLGPIAATFSGEARIIRDDGSRRGLVLGAGSDPLSGSRAAGEIEYVVLPASAGARMEIAMRAALAGPLAQFSRAGIVDDLVARIVEAFARNLEASLTGREAEFEAQANAPLQAGALLRQVLMARLKAVLARVFGGGGR